MITLEIDYLAAHPERMLRSAATDIVFTARFRDKTPRDAWDAFNLFSVYLESADVCVNDFRWLDERGRETTVESPVIVHATCVYTRPGSSLRRTKRMSSMPVERSAVSTVVANLHEGFSAFRETEKPSYCLVSYTYSDEFALGDTAHVAIPVPEELTK